MFDLHLDLEERDFLVSCIQDAIDTIDLNYIYEYRNADLTFEQIMERAKKDPNYEIAVDLLHELGAEVAE